MSRTIARTISRSKGQGHRLMLRAKVYHIGRTGRQIPAAAETVSMQLELHLVSGVGRCQSLLYLITLNSATSKTLSLELTFHL